MIKEYTMDLSKKDRLFLINQYEILKELKSDSSSYYEELIEILQNGYETFYSQFDGFVYDGMSSEQSRLVFDILDVYRSVEDYKKNNPGDEEIEGHLWSNFKGFDGNNEIEYMAFAKFLIEKQGKFAEQLVYQGETDNYNSHMPTLDKYRNMVQKWRELGGNYETSKDHILEILNA